MARYIVIEVTDNKVAENLIVALNEKTKNGWPARVIGAFVKPNRTCSCPNWRVANYRENKQKHGFSGGVDRGMKFGWWVCTECGRPRKGTHNLVNQLLPSECFSEAEPQDPDWEFTVDGLTIGSIASVHINRPKKLKKRKKNG